MAKHLDIGNKETNIKIINKTLVNNVYNQPSLLHHSDGLLEYVGANRKIL